MAEAVNRLVLLRSSDQGTPFEECEGAIEGCSEEESMEPQEKEEENQMAPRRHSRGRGRARASTQGPKTYPNDPVNFMVALQNMAAVMQATAEALGQQMNNNHNRGNGDNGTQGPMMLATFLKVNPPKFKGTTNPTEANTWFHAMERALQAQLVPEEQCVETANELELLLLKQGAMSVSEYTDKFEELFRFFRICQGASGDFDEWKCIKYKAGLRSDIFSSVGPMEIRTFSELVNMSRVAEECVKKAAAERGTHRGPFPPNQGKSFAPRGLPFKRGGFVPQRAQGQNNFRRPNNNNVPGRRFGKQPLNEQACARCRSYHPVVPCKAGWGLCYSCGKPGHKASNCLEKQRQGAGRAQQPGRVFTTSAVGAEGSEALIEINAKWLVKF
ncbi:uncharacterized protein LOC107640643 [Arachis ipaensis]|uniref:uncharacterized protein LOC107640643 n=1 Tax=Arachis ipaensis TaxID=130454 RepID=UPI0007AF6A49|nr:uncharacterized protein LOC107640643 [Arachis ipaensis]